jgi:hypothetical protein
MPIPSTFDKMSQYSGRAPPIFFPLQPNRILVSRPILNIVKSKTKKKKKKTETDTNNNTVTDPVTQQPFSF